MLSRTLAITALIGLFTLTAVVVLSVPAAATPERVAGDDRIATAVEAAQQGWQQADTVVLATADDFPDALSATALAADVDGPLLLTAGDHLPSSVAAEIERLGAQRVIVLGGDDAVDASLERQLAALATSPEVERMAGDTRFATAAEVAAEGGDTEEAVVVLGDDFPDAVSAGALAVTEPAPPVLLAHRDEIPDATLDALAELGVERVSLVGGTAAISEAAAEQLREAGLSVERLAGADRYWTSVRVAEEAEQRGGGATAVLATGASHADALAAGALVARQDGLLLLAAPAQPNPANDAFLRERAASWDAAQVLGGPGALSSEAVAALGRSLQGEPHPEARSELTSAPEPAPGEVAVQAAREQLGTPYRYGGNGPGAFDCSGLTGWAWRAAGVELPRVSRDQFAAYPQVPRSQAQPGDLIAWGSPVHHVAVYAGDGMMIEAPSWGGHVREVPVRGGYRGFVRPTG